jgi:hypothetical protein
VVSLATAAALVFLLAGRRDEFVTALSAAEAGVLVVTVLLQVVALVARSEAWHLTIGAAGGTVNRRVLYRASSMQVLGSVVNGHLGVAARIAALRRSSPEVSPQVPTLIAAGVPDPRRRGDAGRVGVVHARRTAGPPPAGRCRGAPRARRSRRRTTGDTSEP